MGHRLADADVRALRQEYHAADPPVQMRDIARRWGVSPQLVSLLVRGKARVEAGGPIGKRPRRYASTPRRFSDAAIRSMREQYRRADPPISIAELARRWEVSGSWMRTVIKGLVRQDAGGPVDPCPARHSSPPTTPRPPPTLAPQRAPQTRVCSWCGKRVTRPGAYRWREVVYCDLGCRGLAERHRADTDERGGLRHCEVCGVVMRRQRRPSGRIEEWREYDRRKACSPSCAQILRRRRGQ